MNAPRYGISILKTKRRRKTPKEDISRPLSAVIKADR